MSGVRGHSVPGETSAPAGLKQPGSGRRQTEDQPSLVKLLRAIGTFFPGDRLKTTCYRRLVARPRRLLRQALGGFYRIDQIYEVLEEARAYHGELSILEFGTHHGYAFTKMLFATEYMGLSDRVTV